MRPGDLEVDVDALLAETGWVRALARRLVSDWDLAEDVAQDAQARPSEPARKREL